MKYSVPAWLYGGENEIWDWDILMPYQEASEPDLDPDWVSGYWTKLAQEIARKLPVTA